MLLLRMSVLTSFLLFSGIQLGYTQSDAEDFRDEFLNQFDNASQKIVALAEAMPEDTYDWSPDGEAMPVAQVFMHIARYNYLLPQNLDIEIPDEIDTDTMEEIDDKEEVIGHLKKSVEHVREEVGNLSQRELEESTELYGRSMKGWAVLFQLQTHKNEHVGQSISYARMNDVVPPWSE